MSHAMKKLVVGAITILHVSGDPPDRIRRAVADHTPTLTPRRSKSSSFVVVRHEDYDSLIARQREVDASADNGPPHRDNLPVRLDGH